MIEGPFKQNNILELPTLQQYRYENLFNVYLNDDKYVYNLLAKVNFPDNIDPNYFNVFVVPNNNISYTNISYLLYGTPLLWWLICSANKITNPVFFPQAGTELKVLKSNVVSVVLQGL